MGIVANAGRRCPFRFSEVILADESEKRDAPLMDDQIAAAELREARRIVADLARIEDQLSASDKRFLASWQQYLGRAGDGAVIGKYKLILLRRVIAVYELDRALSA
jgi:hypothetical protein